MSEDGSPTKLGMQYEVYTHAIDVFYTYAHYYEYQESSNAISIFYINYLQYTIVADLDRYASYRISGHVRVPTLLHRARLTAMDCIPHAI